MVIFDLLYFLKTIQVLSLILNFFYLMNIMLQLYQENVQPIFVSEHYPGGEPSQF